MTEGKKSMIETPSATGTNGRFQAGNQAAVGHSGRGQKLRYVMLGTITEDDIKAVVVTLVRLARAGNLAAAKLLLDRTIGKVSVGEPAGGEQTPDSIAAIERDTVAITARIERLRREEQATRAIDVMRTKVDWYDLAHGCEAGCKPPSLKSVWWGERFFVPLPHRTARSE